MNKVIKCTTCKLEKFYDYFQNSKSTHDKICYSCKECVNYSKRCVKIKKIFHDLKMMRVFQLISYYVLIFKNIKTVKFYYGFII